MRTTLLATVLLGLGTLPVVHASPVGPGAGCVAKVLHSEELPFAPMGYWLVRVTLQVIPASGPPFIATLQHDVPWQKAAPRRGETFAVRCDPANALIY